MYQINVDTKEITKLTEALRGLHRSSYPIAVRQTLNDLAFDVKQNGLLNQAKQTFTVRNPALFKKFSKVDKATGFDVGAMRAESGMLKSGPGKTFDKQEVGGSYEHENIPTDNARAGGNKIGRINKSNWINGKKLDLSKRNRLRTRKSQFVADAYMSKKLGMAFKFNKTIFKTISFARNGKGLKIKTKALYTSKDNQRVTVEATRFIEKTALKTINAKAERFYKRAVNQQFKKYFK